VRTSSLRVDVRNGRGCLGVAMRSGRACVTGDRGASGRRRRRWSASGLGAVVQALRFRQRRELLERGALDLTDPFAGEAEGSADLIERLRLTVVEPRSRCDARISGRRSPRCPSASAASSSCASASRPARLRGSQRASHRPLPRAAARARAEASPCAGTVLATVVAETVHRFRTSWRCQPSRVSGRTKNERLVRPSSWPAAARKTRSGSSNRGREI
jgi:hypothetical protein